jgi:hypothetical protein
MLSSAACHTFRRHTRILPVRRPVNLDGAYRIGESSCSNVSCGHNADKRRSTLRVERRFRPCSPTRSINAPHSHHEPYRATRPSTAFATLHSIGALVAGRTNSHPESERLIRSAYHRLGLGTSPKHLETRAPCEAASPTQVARTSEVEKTNRALRLGGRTW